MDFNDPKTLKKLADSCRKAGITSFKGFGVEFTLGQEPQKVARRNRKAAAEQTLTGQGPAGPMQIAAPKKPQNDEIETDSLSTDELLFWSSGDEQESSAA